MLKGSYNFFSTSFCLYDSFHKKVRWERGTSRGKEENPRKEITNWDSISFPLSPHICGYYKKLFLTDISIFRIRGKVIYCIKHYHSYWIAKISYSISQWSQEWDSLTLKLCYLFLWLVLSIVFILTHQKQSTYPQTNRSQNCWEPLLWC